MKIINAKTQEEFDKVMEIFEKKGWRWCNGGLPTKSPHMWAHKDKTCIRYQDSFGCSDINFYNNNYGYEIISFQEFLKLEGVEEFKYGEKVLVKNDGDWTERIYLTTITGNAYLKYICVDTHYEKQFISGDQFGVCKWKKIKKLEPKEDEEIEKAIKLLTEKGKLKDGKILIN